MIESEKIVEAVHWMGRFRYRIIAILMVPLIATIGVYFFSDYLIKIISIPLSEIPLFFMTPVEGVMTRVKVAFFGGLIITSPVMIYMLISLVSSKLTKKTRRILYFLIVPFGTIAFAGGIYFGYTLVLPTTMKFLLSCASDFMTPMISGSNYVSFVTLLLIAIGLIFELPLIMVTLSKIGIVNSKMLMEKRKIAIMAIVVIVALITPTPDAFTLLIVSLPMLALYELSIWWIFILEKIERKKVNQGKSI